MIKTLTDMAYEYVEINEETNLISNFKRQLEKHNAKELASHGRTELTDNEFNKVMLYLEGGTTFEIAKKLNSAPSTVRAQKRRGISLIKEICFRSRRCRELLEN